MTHVKIVILGFLPIRLDTAKIKKYKSAYFHINSRIDNLTISNNSDLGWHYSDNNINMMLPDTFDGDVLFVITKVPLEGNYYTRALPKNKVCISLYEISDILNANNIDLENFILRMIYNIVLMRMAFDRCPTIADALEIVHDETRGCIFDMTGIKTEIIYSASKPTICEDCSTILKRKKVPKNIIEDISNELKQIRKGTYYRISDWIKEHPILTIGVSSVAAIILGIFSSYLFELLRPFIMRA